MKLQLFPNFVRLKSTKLNQLKMKKSTLFITFCFLITTSAFSQTVNGIPLKELNVHAEYIRVSEKQIYLSKKINIDIDYGQSYRIKNIRVLDGNGNPMEFNSMIEVLNFMSSLGYELVNGGDNISSFLLRKKESALQPTNTSTILSANANSKRIE
jgi:hypothetical protein